MNFFNGTLKAGPGNTVRFDEGTFSFDVPAAMSAALASHNGKPVVMGIRPENMDEAASAPQGPVIEAKVEVIEMMGSEVYLYANTGKSTFTARVAPTCQRKIGDTVRIALAPSKLHFFDSESGVTLV